VAGTGLRIIGGAARGRRLLAPKGRTTRPVTGRVRSAVFNILGPSVASAAVLDLFAGSGAMGLEALSRGADRCVFVERNRAALEALERNIAALSVAERTRAEPGDALRVDPARWRGPFDLVFVDPPYALADRVDEASSIGGLMSNLFGGRLLNRPAQVVVRTPAASGPLWVPAGAEIVDARTYGADAVRFVAPRPAGTT